MEMADFYNSRMLLSLLALLFTVIVHTNCLQCQSDRCSDGSSLCTMECGGSQNRCLAQYHIPPTGSIVTSYFGCFNVPRDSCNSPVCNPTRTAIGTFECCCTDDLCNDIPCVTSECPTDVSIPTAYPTVPIPDRPEVYQICEQFNCSMDNSQECFHGYEVCSESPQGSTVPDHQQHLCQAIYILNETSRQFRLRDKGCFYNTSDVAAIAQLCTPGECVIDTTQPANILHCCCDGFVCNQNITFTNPALVQGAVRDVCVDAGCSNSCIIHGEEVHCLCNEGFALANGTTCIDINECVVNNPCTSPAECENEVGSYHCECPVGYRLNPDGVSCNKSILVCEKLDCPPMGACSKGLEYCEDTTALEGIFPENFHCQTTFLLSADGNCIEPRLSSCIHGSEFDPPCTVGFCNPLPLESDPNVYHCCCRGDLCNSNFTLCNNASPSVPTPTSPTTTSVSGSNPLSSSSTSSGSDLETSQPASTNSPTTTPAPQTSDESDLWSNPTMFIIVTTVAVSFTVLLAIGVAILYCKYWKAAKQQQPQPDEERESPDSPILSADAPILQEMIGRGRFAKVWKARQARGSRQQCVAVKSFQALGGKDSWEREIEIYNALLQHKNVLQFIDSMAMANELWIVFEYHPKGSLYDLLKVETITLNQFYQLAESAAAGLAYLHEEKVIDGVTKKLAIAHRDLKSKNILVKSNFTCCISDFGLALKFEIGESRMEAAPQVGTSRYMAPEVLEGAINFQREAFKRIDSYAFGLILWELASRTVVEEAHPVDDYRPPFDDCVSSNPSIEEMKHVVVTLQRRPEIPTGFRKNAYLDNIEATINESWDQDAEARLSAQCIMERLRMYIKPSKAMSKDSGFTEHSLSPHNYHHEPLNSDDDPDPFNAPQTPSLSSGSVTMSPLDSKPPMAMSTPEPFSGSESGASTLRHHFTMANPSNDVDNTWRHSMEPSNDHNLHQFVYNSTETTV